MLYIVFCNAKTCKLNYFLIFISISLYYFKNQKAFYRYYVEKHRLEEEKEAKKNENRVAESIFAQYIVIFKSVNITSMHLTYN